MASQQAAAVAAAIMQGQAPGANPASLQAAANYFEQVHNSLLMSSVCVWSAEAAADPHAADHASTIQSLLYL